MATVGVIGLKTVNNFPSINQTKYTIDAG